MTISVLFLCTGNSARSILAEAVLRSTGGGFEAWSAGTHPRGVHPLTERVLRECGIEASGLYSKPMDAVAANDFDYVVTLCDDAAEHCPIFPGRAEVLHWSIKDPAAATGSEDEKMVAFRAAFNEIQTRVRAFVPLAQRVAARRERRRGRERCRSSALALAW